MPLRLPDKWVWDFWFARNDGQHHIFYLQALRALGQPALRHHNATIGHAVSSDAREWHVLPDAIRPGAEGSWDDLATWTGSAIGHQGRWYMLYTGVKRAEQGLVQRIGLAVSDDLISWEKHAGNPVLEADPRWYEMLDQQRWRDQSWRDPWLFRCSEDDLFHVLVTARSPFGSPDGAGVLGHARSADLVDWEVLPPLTEHGEFAQVEVPQLVQFDDGYMVLFSCHAEDHSPKRLKRLGAAGRGGTFALLSKSLYGPWSSSDSPIETPDDRKLGVAYAGRLFEGQTGRWQFMAFRGDDDRDFLGELTDPIPIEVTATGRIIVLADESSVPTRRAVIGNQDGAAEIRQS
jgi:beta-fructofuranosidase